MPAMISQFKMLHVLMWLPFAQVLLQLALEP
jgi:hypothetical protein